MNFFHDVELGIMKFIDRSYLSLRQETFRPPKFSTKNIELVLNINKKPIVLIHQT